MSQQPPPYPGQPEKGGQPNAYTQGYGATPGPYPGQGPPGQAGYPQQPAYGQPAQYNPPPPPGYHQAGTSTVVVTQPTYPVVQMFRETPVQTKCQFCQADIVTTTCYETGTLTWVACFVTVFVGCWLGCCLIPFCLDACKDVVHQCPNCQQTVGRYNRM